MMKADLHMHSDFSDGSVSISELIGMAAARGLDAISITDHDTFSHWDKLPANPPIRIIPGLEISATDRDSGLRVHLLAYNVKRPEIVAALTQPLLEARHRNTMRQVEILKANGYKIDSGTLKMAGGRYLYKVHVMEQLVETGQAEEMFGALYRKLFKGGGICDFDIDYIDANEAVRAVRDAGGQVVLAHAGQQQNFHLIPGLVSNGLSGLELNHPSNKASDKAILRDYADKFKLFMTGGSDFHGKYERPDVGVGDFLADESGAEAVCRI